MTITCVITDDEPMARKGLQSYVERVDFLSLTGVCEDAIQLNTLLKTQQPDLLLLDIEMPYLSGLDLLAVSYTHLDVYKRQTVSVAWRSRGRAWWTRESVRSLSLSLIMV